MRKQFTQTTTNLLLSALMLASTCLPPALRHAHEGGDEANHRHDTSGVRHLKHGHHEAEGYHEHEVVSITERAVLSDAVVHLHWAIFGIDFSTTLPSEPRSREPAVVRVMVMPAISVSGENAVGVLTAIASQPGLDFASVRSVGTTPLQPPNLVTSAPLCDSARRERSGVLLV
jgi:hypothetical protein